MFCMINSSGSLEIYAESNNSDVFALSHFMKSDKKIEVFSDKDYAADGIKKPLSFDALPVMQALPVAVPTPAPVVAAPVVAPMPVIPSPVTALTPMPMQTIPPIPPVASPAEVLAVSTMQASEKQQRDMIKSKLTAMGVEFNNRLRLPSLQKLLADEERRNGLIVATAGTPPAPITAPAIPAPVIPVAVSPLPVAAPIAPVAQVAAPVVVEAPVVAPAAVPATAPALTFEVVKDQLLKVAQVKDASVAMGLLSEFGAKKITEVSPDMYPALYERAEGLCI